MHKLLLSAFIIMVGLSAPAPVLAENVTPYAAPDIASTGEWFNSPPLSAKDLKGKVVLVDFWTYSCINCLRTFPYIKSWYQQYKDKGFVVIGIHTPEFEFEKDKAKVEKALKRFDIPYPVVQDNDMTVWKRFANKYWPAHYLINKNGQIVYTHFGEGSYDVTEAKIRELLNENGDKAKLSGAVDGWAASQTPETYLGTARSERMQKSPDNLPIDNWALSGEWKRDNESSVADKSGASLKMHFRGGKVFLVLGSMTGKPVHAKILYNGKPALDVGGKDVKNGAIEITEHRLYELLALGKNGDGMFELQSHDAGLQAFAFTFGGY